MTSACGEEPTMYGFPPGYFQIRAVNSNYYGKRMLLDAARSERKPGVELVLWVDEAQSKWNFKQEPDDSQVFFMSEDGLLRSKSTGHPIGCTFDQPDAPKLEIQPPQPFNYAPRPRCQFEYDPSSQAIYMRLPPDAQLQRQSSVLSRRDTDASSISFSITSSDGCPSPTSPEVLPSSPATSMNSSRLGIDRPYMLEFVPRGHHQSRIVQFFDTVLESPTEEQDLPPPSPSPAGAPLGRLNRHDEARNDSWHKGRDVKLVRERKSRPVNGLQKWQIIRLPEAPVSG